MVELICFFMFYLRFISGVHRCTAGNPAKSYAESWLRRAESLKREALNREDNGSAFVRQPPGYGAIGYADFTDAAVGEKLGRPNQRPACSGFFRPAIFGGDEIQ